jgi:hypothetical protein
MLGNLTAAMPRCRKPDRYEFARFGNSIARSTVSSSSYRSLLPRSVRKLKKLNVKDSMVRLRKAQSVRNHTVQKSWFMVAFNPLRVFPVTSLLSLSTMAIVSVGQPITQAQTPDVPDEVPALPEEESPEPAAAPDGDLRPLAQGGSILSIQGGQRLMDEASTAVSAQNYDLAVSKLQEARQVFNQLSNFYQELAASFSGIDNRIAGEQRNQAVETAQMRDQATYQLALVHRAQNKPELAVPLLVQIIRSQNPTRDLGQQAYRQLLELGFVDSPYPRNSEEPTSANPSP